MICRLCLKEAQQILPMFTDNAQTVVASVVSKHFWFEPKCDDPISTAVCFACWTEVFTFHEFYLKVEEAHRLLTERFFIETNDTPKSGKENQRHSNEDEADVLDANAFIFEIVNDDESLDADNVVEEVSSSSKLLEQSAESEEQQETNTNENDDNVELPPVETSNKRALRSHTRALANNAMAATSDMAAAAEAVATPVRRRGRPRKSSVNVSVSSVSPKNKKGNNFDKRIAEHMQLKCNICCQKAEKFADLVKHMNKVHNCLAYVTCCDKKFFKRSHLADHVEKHMNPDHFRCFECDKNFADKQCLRNHMLLKHHPEETRYFACLDCPKKFAKRYLLEQHRITHEERTHICDVCQKGFASRSLLSSHIKMAHSNYGTMCEVCAKVLRGRSAFERHMLQHSGKPIAKVQCNKCHSWHKDKYSLQKHIRRHNEEGQQHICSICKKVAPNRSALLSHIRYVHRSQRIFDCTLCSKSFKKPLNLKEHMASHTGEVLYRCPHCPKTFNSNANMHSHRKKNHPKEFNEMREKRRQARHKPFIDPDTEAATTASRSVNSTLDDSASGKNSTEDDMPQIITITADDETHDIIVSKYDGDDDEGEAQQSFILTVEN